MQPGLLPDFDNAGHGLRDKVAAGLGPSDKEAAQGMKAKHPIKLVYERKMRKGTTRVEKGGCQDKMEG